MTDTNTVTSLAVDSTIAIVTVHSPPVNALSAQVRHGILQAFQTAIADQTVEAVILICEGRTFFVGADISEFGKPPKEPSLRDVLNVIENSPKPIVAAIHGTALGGGMETALACNYRIAVPSAKLGFPEVKLGLLPGAGGTQRLPRIVGAQKALEMLTDGAPVDAEAALAMYLVDALAPEKELRAAALGFARSVLAEKRPLLRVRDREVTGATAELFADFRKATTEKFGGFKAPEANIACIEAAATQSFDDGMATERRLFLELMNDNQSAAQRHVFFAERQAAKVPGLPADAKIPAVGKICIISGDAPVTDITTIFQSAGISVAIVEMNQLGPDMKILGDCDFVIETTLASMPVKKDIFRKLDRITPPHTIFATTSYVDIDELATATSRPKHVLGLNFLVPANVTRLLEVVRGTKTAPEVLSALITAAKKIGKVAVISRAGTSSISNRMLSRFHGEAERLILEGMTPWHIDLLMHSFGLPHGSIQIADLADLGVSRLTGGPKNEIILASQMAAAQRPIDDQEVLERCLYPMINEGAKLLEEGLANRPSDIDIAWVYGLGWPAYRGGPMFYADMTGIKVIRNRLRSYETRYGRDFAPADLLNRLADEGRGFRDL